MIAFWNEKVRPILDKHPGVVLGIVAVCAIASAVFGIRSWTNGGSPIATQPAYFTCDGGKTLFEDNDPLDIPPFQHDGQEAVRAYFVPGKAVGRTDSIWYLMKMSDEQKQRLETMTADGPVAPPPTKGVTSGADHAKKSLSPFGGQLVKRPGDAEWVPMDDPKSADILRLP